MSTLEKKRTMLIALAASLTEPELETVFAAVKHADPFKGMSPEAIHFWLETYGEERARIVLAYTRPFHNWRIEYKPALPDLEERIRRAVFWREFAGVKTLLEDEEDETQPKLSEPFLDLAGTSPFWSPHQDFYQDELILNRSSESIPYIARPPLCCCIGYTFEGLEERAIRIEEFLKLLLAGNIPMGFDQKGSMIVVVGKKSTKKQRREEGSAPKKRAELIVQAAIFSESELDAALEAAMMPNSFVHFYPDATRFLARELGEERAKTITVRLGPFYDWKPELRPALPNLKERLQRAMIWDGWKDVRTFFRSEKVVLLATLSNVIRGVHLDLHASIVDSFQRTIETACGDFVGVDVWLTMPGTPYLKHSSPDRLKSVLRIRFRHLFQDPLWSLLPDSAQDALLESLVYCAGYAIAENMKKADEFEELLGIFLAGNFPVGLDMEHNLLVLVADEPVEEHGTT